MLLFCVDKNCACQENFLRKVGQTVECQGISYGVGESPSKTGRAKRLACGVPVIKDPQELALCSKNVNVVEAFRCLKARKMEMQFVLVLLYLKLSSYSSICNKIKIKVSTSFWW